MSKTRFKLGITHEWKCGLCKTSGFRSIKWLPKRIIMTPNLTSYDWLIFFLADRKANNILTPQQKRINL